MPRPRRPETDGADALIAVALLASRLLERRLAAHEPPLTVAQYLALRAIEGGAPTASELARRANVSGPAVSQLLAGLAEAGLIERRRDDDDRRSRALTLSPAGARVLASAGDQLREQVTGLLGELPGRERETLARLLPRLEGTIAGQPPPRRPPPRSSPGGPPGRGHRP